MTVSLFVVDDSAVMRQGITALVGQDSDIRLAGTAPNPLIAAPMIRRNPPDVLLLDIEMPGMDGLTFLRQQMAERPIPTIICSTLTQQGSTMALEALAAGAVAVIAKPNLGLQAYIAAARRELLQAVRTAAQARPQSRPVAAPVLSAASALAARAPKPGGQRTLAIGKPVVIGASTGGVQALETVLSALPLDAPGIAIVQHMPGQFTGIWAKNLDRACAMTVREAVDGARLERGVALIAPGGRHMELKQSAGHYYAVVKDGPPVNRHTPSVDVLFRSVAQRAGSDALAIILTGMGGDGARGMKLMHEAGAYTIAQDEASSVVFGMPKEAIALGGVSEVLPLERIAAAILRFDARA